MSLARAGVIERRTLLLALLLISLLFLSSWSAFALARFGAPADEEDAAVLRLVNEATSATTSLKLGRYLSVEAPEALAFSQSSRYVELEDSGPNRYVAYPLGEFQSVTSTHFEGTILADTSIIGAWNFLVSVDKWLDGQQPCSNPINVTLPVSPDCTGVLDPSLEKGDKVEVYGDLPFGGCYVSLCWDGYMKMISAACCPCDLTLYKEVYNYAEDVEITLKFCGPPETPPSGEIVCGWVPYTQPFSFRKIEGCDNQTYWIDCSSHADLCNNVSNYTGWYIRLFNVTIEGYTVANDPLIGGYERIERIAGCFDCELKEACDPEAFTVLLHEDASTTSNITNEFAKLATGFYRATLSDLEPGAKTVEVNVADCASLEEDFVVAASGEVVDCINIDTPGVYTLVNNIPGSAAECCINITASDVTFDGNGHYISAAEVIGVERYATGVCVGSNQTLHNVTVKNLSNVWNWDIGISFSGVENGRIANNGVRWNDDYGIFVVNSNRIEIAQNDVESNLDGIFLMDSSNNSITNNTAEANYNGIGLLRSSNNTVKGNTASGGSLGIDLYQRSNDNLLAENTIENNLQHGLCFGSNCTGNMIIENFICSNNQECGNYYDITVNSSNCYGSSGSNNTCSKSYGWDDDGYMGCTYPCTPTRVISVIDRDRLTALYNDTDVEALMQGLDNYSQRNAGVRYNLTKCRADFDADPNLTDAFSYRNNTDRSRWDHYPGFVEGYLTRMVRQQANHFNISMANISLLLVGNDNVTPFHRISVRVANWENSYETVPGNIMWSDYPYSDLDNDGDPDISVSRLIGNAQIMRSTLENARTQYQSNTVLMAGMKSTLNIKDRQIGNEFNTTWGFNNDSIYKYFEETDDIADVRIGNLSFLDKLDDGHAIIFLNSHGNDYRDLGKDMHEFSDEKNFEPYKILLTAQNVADIGLGNGHPFVSSEQCHGGVTYPDDDASHNMPLAFLSSEAVGYVGSTVYSPFGASDDSGYWFYQSCKDKNSVGRAHLDARQSAWAAGSYYKMFAEAWTLYGDPLYEIYVPNDPASKVGYNSSTEIDGENTTLKLSILSYDMSKVYTPQGDRDIVTISGAYSTTAYADNKPVIPMIIHRIKLPQTRDFKEITGVTKSDVVFMEDVTLPLGCPSRQDENCYGGYCGNTLNLTKLYPNESVEYEILETADGDRQIFFRIFPLEYNESANSIYLYKNITLTFETKNATPKLPVQLSLTENYRDEIIAGYPTEIGMFLSNHGEASAKNLSILEEIPAGFDVSFVSGNGTYYPSTNTIAWNIGTITPWDFKMLIYELIASNTGDYMVNTTIGYTDEYGTVYPSIIVSKSIYVGVGNQIFDTDHGTYPSISGRHNGTIMPFSNMSVSGIYTYPCPGTGGHTEYAALSYSNGTVIAEARWDGYMGDWHNLTFNKTFTLHANETYTYTVQTGSYPQLHQNATRVLPAGEITCTQFTDANGRIAAPRVPAIKFF